MASQKKQHSSRSQSVHKLLLARIQEEGFSSEVMRDFMWLINAHYDLIAFPVICKNVSQMLSLAKQHWGLTEKDFHLEGISPILNWIFDNGQMLSQEVGDDFIRSPKHCRDHPVMNRGSRRHPLYTTLWNTCSNKKLKEQYLLLQTHLLFAHVVALFSENNRDQYEAYTGDSEWKGLANSPYIASLAVRELSLEIYSEELASLPVRQQPSVFAKTIRTLGQVNKAKTLNRLHALESFLQKSLEIRDWRTHQISGQSGRGGGAHITGYIDFNKTLIHSDTYLGDLDDTDNNWGSQSQVSEIILEPSLHNNLSDLDLCPEEFTNQELILSNFEINQLPLGGYAAATAAQVRHVVQANQLFQWSYSYLSVNEVAEALNKTSKWVNVVFGKSAMKPKQADIDKLESICLMRIMLFTASTYERAEQIKVLTSIRDAVDVPLAFILSNSNQFLWKVRGIQPDYRSIKKVNGGTEKERAEYFFLQDVANTGYYINLLLKHRNSTINSNEQNAKQNFQLFRHRREKLLGNLKALLSELDPTGRLTVTKLSKFLFGRLLRETKGDICAASLLSGDEHTLAHVRLFYSVIPISKIQKHYFEATEILVALLHQALNRRDFKFDTQIKLNQNRYLGSRLCPTRDAVKNAVTNLHLAIAKAKKNNDLVQYHNCYTLLILWQFSFMTACRAIQTPYLSLSELDIETGIGMIADKDDSFGYKSRLIWLPPAIVNAMQKYDQHRLSILQNFPDAKKEDLPVFFIKQGRKNKMKVVTVRPKTLLQVMDQFLPYPPNFHRRFISSELLERGCAIEVVDAWMGHWHAGEEPWSMHSSFNFLSYREALHTYLVPILRELGLLNHLHFRTVGRGKTPRAKPLNK